MTAFNRRLFLNRIGVLSAASWFTRPFQSNWNNDLQQALQKASHVPAQELAGDEDFWFFVQQAYTASPSLINLNNGGVAPSPIVVQEAMKKYHDMCNEGPSYYMWRVLDQGREPLRQNLARLAGCSAEEIAIHRNASEALETVIFGLDLKRGDEVVLSKFDYPNMMNAWKQREMREGIKLVWVTPTLPAEDKDYLVNTYVKAFTPKTKVVHLTHVVNWNGQILPVKAIADAAHARGIEVVVDGAHSFAHFQFTIPETGADYFGTSLHKWLSACIGSGMLYVKKDKIKNLYPLFAAPDAKSDDIRKFETLGTRPFFIEQAIGKAIEFYEMIGAQRKEQRLFYLKNYWMNQVKDIPKVTFYTSMKPGFGCALGVVHVEGKRPLDMEDFLWRNYKIHVTTIDYENLKGVRVTPNVYTTTRNLDLLATAIAAYAKT
jgi:selenocysteine lyase/cysteine desulfurase